MYEKYFSESEQSWLIQNKLLAKHIFESLEDSENVNPLDNGEPDLEPLNQALIAAKITIEANRIGIIEGPYDEKHSEMISTYLGIPSLTDEKRKKFWNFFSISCGDFQAEHHRSPKERIYMEGMKECIRAMEELENFDIGEGGTIDVADLDTGKITKLKLKGVNTKY